MVIERIKFDNFNTHIESHPLSWLGTGTSMKSDEVKLVLCAPTYTLSEKMLSCKCFPHVSTMPTPTYDWVNSVVIKNAIFLLNKSVDIKYSAHDAFLE